MTNPTTSTKFSKNMIGKRVKEKGDSGTYDEGVITKECEHFADSVYVMWHTGSFKGKELHIALESVWFLDELPDTEESSLPEVLIINGHKYKLVKE